MDIEDQSSQLQFVQVYNAPSSPEDLRFDHIISAFQQILIHQHFEKTLSKFMYNHWHILDQGNAQQVSQVFQSYRAELQKYLSSHIAQSVPDFNWKMFGELFQNRRNRVDEQILDTLLSMEQVENFKLFIKDYRNSYEEEQMFRVLTIKSNKVPENKKVKGKDNIFAGNQAPGLFDKGLKAPAPKKMTQPVQKTQEELLVPDLVLTIKPMRKG